MRYGRPSNPAGCNHCGGDEHQVDQISTAYAYLTIAAPKSVYVSRKADVAKLDEFVGPKR